MAIVERGVGDAVVFVHGTMGGAADWYEVARRLASRYRTIAFDRRGRGRSTDGGPYSLEREIDDVIAVVDSIGLPVHLVGHSFGAVVALLAARALGHRLTSLALYEPPIGGSGAGADALADELDQLIAAGRSDHAVAMFAGAAEGSDDHLEGLPEHVREALRDAVRTAGREIRAASAVLPFDAALLDSIRTPSLVLLGEEQHLESYDGVAVLAERLPDAQLATVPGRHLAILSAPAAFAERLEAFWSATARAARDRH